MSEDKSTGRPGRPYTQRTLRALASRRAREAVDVLAEVATNADAPASDRVRAAELLLSHAMPLPMALGEQ